MDVGKIHAGPPMLSRRASRRVPFEGRDIRLVVCAAWIQAAAQKLRVRVRRRACHKRFIRHLREQLRSIASQLDRLNVVENEDAARQNGWIFPSGALQSPRYQYMSWRSTAPEAGAPCLDASLFEAKRILKMKDLVGAARFELTTPCAQGIGTCAALAGRKVQINKDLFRKHLQP